MNPDTGRIIEILNSEYAEKRGLVPIPPHELPKMKWMSKAQRKAWAAKQPKGRVSNP